MPHISYIKYSKYKPVSNSKLQTFRPVKIKGELLWEITSYTLEEKNDGSEEYRQMFLESYQIQLKTIEKLQNEKTIWDQLSENERQHILHYKSLIENVTSFPVNFKFPQKPYYNLFRIKLPPEINRDEFII